VSVDAHGILDEGTNTDDGIEVMVLVLATEVQKIHQTGSILELLLEQLIRECLMRAAGVCF
jgi:hypothetical protein